MEMGGILKFAPIEEAVILALRAGIHLMEICHSPELILRAWESILSRAERSPGFRKLLLARAAQAKKLRVASFSPPPTKAPAAAQLSVLRDLVLRFQNTVQEAQKQ
jgi:beta-N-acetylhexosaminidase